jgi:hypothetical protein
MLCPSIGACNRNNFCESFTKRAATQTCFGDEVRSSGHRFAPRRRSNGFIMLLLLPLLFSPRSERWHHQHLRKRSKTSREISPGLFVHTGVMELMKRGNEGAIAKCWFRHRSRCGVDSRMFRMARNVSAEGGRTRRATCSRTNGGRQFGDLMGCDIARIDTRARLRSISLPLRPGRVADR